MGLKRTTIGLATGLLTVGALALSACGVSNSGGAGNDQAAGSSSTSSSSAADMASKFSTCDTSKGAKDVSATQGTGKDGTSVKIAAFSGWDESIASAYLMKNVLNDDGYKASVKVLQAAPAFTALAQGDVDVLTDVWLPKTHKTYIDKYGSKLESLGCWYDSAKLTIAVNKSSPAQSIADLKTMGDKYNNTITGIEPGAGETGVVKNEMMPAYGLDNMKLVTSSTSAMLAAIRKSENDNSNVVVTLWKPHWAYSAFDIRDLKDPKGAMGGKEGIWNFATKGFGKDHPKAAQLFDNLIIPDSDLSQLEYLMSQKYKGKNPDAAVHDWLGKHPEFAKKLAKGSLG